MDSSEVICTTQIPFSPCLVDISPTRSQVNCDT